MRRVRAWLVLVLLCAPGGVTAQDVAPAAAADPPGAPQQAPTETQEAPAEAPSPTATERPTFNLRHYMPAALQEQVLGIDHWQWLGILALLVIAWTVQKTVAYMSGRIIGRLVLRRTGLSRTSTAARENLKGIGILAAAGVIALLDDYLMLPSPQWQLVPKIVASVGVMLLAYRLADVVGARLEDAAERSESKLDDQLAPMARKVLKVFITAGAVLFVLENLEVDIWSLLAGLGVIGIGVGLAAKDTFANFFGSITVLADKPFQIGDWVVIANVEGTVEEIGFRSTRIRTFYNSLVTVPNSKLVDSNIDNLGRRTYRRYKTKVGVTYNTPPERISEFCEGIRAIVRAHPQMRQDYFLIHLNDFGPSSLDILVYVFFQVENWSQELAARDEFILGIIRLAKELDVKFAFPSQSLYIEQAPPPYPASP